MASSKCNNHYIYMTPSLSRQNYMPYVDIQVPCAWFQKLLKNTCRYGSMCQISPATFINLLWVIPLCGLCNKNTYFLRSRRPLVPTGSSCWCCSSTHHVSHLFEPMIWFEEQSNTYDNMWTGFFNLSSVCRILRTKLHILSCYGLSMT